MDKKDSEVGIELFNAADLLEMTLPEPKFAVPGLIPQGLTILAGKPKLGKSWLALNLAVSVSAGGKALDSIQTEQGDVLYLALEDNARRLQDRLSKMVPMLCRSKDDVARLGLPTNWPRQDNRGLDEIGNWLTSHPHARLVIIDVWSKFRPARKNRADIYQEDYNHGSEVKKLADTFSVAIIIVHHTRKGYSDDALEEVSGSTGLPGAADAILVLRRPRVNGNSQASLMVTGRDVETKELALTWDKDNGVWNLQGDFAEYRISKERQEVIDALTLNKQPMSPSQVAVALNKTPNTVKQLLFKMKRDGLVRADERGRYSLASP